jgi:CheY-like chemotaxis protein
MPHCGKRMGACMTGASRRGPTIQYRRVLLIEDDVVIASQLARAFVDVGAEVVGPVGSLGRAIEVAETAQFDCALVDIKLKGVDAYPVVDILMRRSLPLAFVTGYDRHNIPLGYRNIPLIRKPVDPSEIARALVG